MKALVTGATGFLGRHLVHALVGRGDEVIALVRPSSKVSDELRAQARLVEGALRDAAPLLAACEGADVVFHCAAITTNRTAWQNHYQVNVQGTEHVLHAALMSNVQRVVYISSVAVYGFQPSKRTCTEATPYASRPEPWAYYVRSKAEADALVLAFGRNRGLPVTVIRPGILYGRGGGAPAQGLGRRGPVWLLIGSGRNVLPFTYVENAVDCILLAATSQKAIGQAYNVVDEPQISGRDAITQRLKLRGERPLFLPIPTFMMNGAGLLAELLTTAARRRTSPPLTRHLVSTACRDIRYDSSKARTELGWQQRFSMEEALHRMQG